MNRKKLFFVFFFLGTVSTAGCGQGSLTMATRYSPLHPSNNAEVTFSVKAEDTDGISQVDLYVFEYELSLRGKKKRALARTGGLWGLVKSWTFDPKPVAIDETYSVPGFLSKSFIRYVVDVTGGKGRKAYEEWVFAAGVWPFKESPVPIWGRHSPSESIDVAFVADKKDYAQPKEMLPDLESLIFDGYHSNNGVQMGKEYWRFYYSQELGSVSDFKSGSFVMDIPESIVSSAIIDQTVVVHKGAMRDWAKGNDFSAKSSNNGVTVHESAHSVFGLMDEFKGGRHAYGNRPYQNTLLTKINCEKYNLRFEWAAEECENIEDDWWRPEPSSQQCLMLEDGGDTVNQFGRSCLYRLKWFYYRLK